ncbi:MAG: hypothetical protein AB4911_09485 [Oscillochloridaceae bacterium umkhey_bin13]
MARFWHTLRALLRELRDWRLWLLVGSTWLGLVLIGQLPVRFSFQVGLDRGPRTDLPFLEGFRDPELVNWEQTWRWTRPEAAITVPGLAPQPLIVSFAVVSHRQHWQPEAGVPELHLQAPGLSELHIPLRYEPTRYYVLLPAEAVTAKQLRLDLASAGWLNPADPRGELGVALGNEVRLTGVPGGGFVWPGGGLLVAYPASMALLWASLRMLGFGRNQVVLLLLGPLLALGLLAILASPHLAVGAGWAVQTGLLTLGTAALAGLALPPLLRRWGEPLDPVTQRWLLLIIVATIALKYGGKLYPVAMPGDVQFHTNRLGFTLNGQFAIPSLHRGLPFPYPSGWYVLLLPLLLTGIPPWPLFQLTAALADATVAVIFFVLLRRMSGSTQAGLLAALIYALSPIPMMNLWWSFQAQIGTQLITMAALALVILGWPQVRGGLAWGWLTVLLTMVFLGHFGAFINVSVVVALTGGWLWWRASAPPERAAARGLFLAGLGAGSFALLSYYSLFVSMFLDQLRGIAAGGVSEVTARAPLERQAWIGALWGAGVVALNGGFLIIMGLAGFGVMLLTPRYRRGPALALIGSTFAVGLSQAVLPLITRSNITTRWLTFAGWGLTLGMAVISRRYLRRGWAGQVVVGLSLASLAWLSLQVWLLAMATNQPPLEPF